MECRWWVGGAVGLGMASLVAGCGDVEPYEGEHGAVGEHSDAVIGGETEPDAYGFTLADDVKNAMVAVSRDGQPLCSGTIIGDRLVVSAGHCFVGNSAAWVEGADPLPLSPADVAALEVRVGPKMTAPECVLSVTEAILNPELALRDLQTQSSHANPHDSAVVVLGESILETCPSAWPARLRREPLTDAVVGQEGLQGGFGGTTMEGVPVNYDRWWSHFTVQFIHELDVQVLPLGASHVWYGDSGSGILLPTEDGGLEVIAAVSNMTRHARVDIDADWFTPFFADGDLCGPATAEGTCLGDAVVTCTLETGLARTDCAELGLSCVSGEVGAECGCACDPCDPSCACAAGDCEAPEGGDGEPDDQAASDGESEGCAIHEPGATGRGGGGPGSPALVLLSALGWMMRRRAAS